MEKHSKLWYFENFNLLEPLTMKEKERLSTLVSMNKTPKGKVIYLPHDSSKNIFFLKSGKVKISRYSDDGKEIIIALLEPGEIFGELALVDSGERAEIAEVVEDAVICGININDMEMMLEKNPTFNLKITKLIGLRMKKVQSRLETLCFKNSEERIRGFIKDIADEHGKKLGTGKEIVVYLRLTHQDISKLTATARQKVTTVFNELEHSGIITYDRKRILIREYDKL